MKVRSLRSGVRFEETSGANLLRGTMVTYWYFKNLPAGLVCRTPEPTSHILWFAPRNEDQVRLGETLVEISFADKACTGWQ